MCYARRNDRDHTLTKLCKKLSEEVEEVIGEEFPIFQDIKDIEWGEDSKERIDESLSEVTFFIPIITPNFFKSEYCRYELKRFLDRENKLGRNDLVLPIYYIETPLLETEAEREIADEDGDSEREIKTLANTISDRQRPSCADWRKLRAKCRNSFNSVEIYESLENLAIQIRDALDRLPPIRIEHSYLEQTKPINTQTPKTRETTSKTYAYSEDEEIIIGQKFGEQPKPKKSQSRKIDLSKLKIHKTKTYAPSKDEEIMIGQKFGEQLKPKSQSRKIDLSKLKIHKTKTYAPSKDEEIMIGQKFGEQLKPKSQSRKSDQSKLKIRKKNSKYGPTHRDIVVDQINGGYATISEAIRAANPGDKILVRPGLYQEGLVVDKPLEIVGDGKRNTVKVHAFKKNALVFNASLGRVANLTLRQIGSNGNWHGVDIVQGKLTLENCDISSQTGACVAIRGEANPHLRRNKIHDGKEDGVLVSNNGKCILEENDIFRNSYSGVVIELESNPTLLSNKIHDGKGRGILVRKNGKGVFANNDIFCNSLAEVTIETGGNPILRHNRIHDGRGIGVYVSDSGMGVIKENDIFGHYLEIE
jgi:parallel beta-helix repeat protein